MKNILITGGSGFIGSNLCRKLADNNKILCLDNYFSSDISNISDIYNKSNFSFYEKDINDKIEINEKIDLIYNLACPASPVHYQSNPVKTIQTNVVGSINLLELAKKNNCKILQSSTSEIYGDPEQHPQSESYWGNVNPIGIRSCYDEGKRCAETLFFEYHRIHDLNIKVVRIFNTYGPGMKMNDGRVVSNFIIQALKNHDITVYGDGSQSRSLCFIDDLVEGLIKMMNSEKQIVGPINLGSNNEITVLDLAQKIINLSNSKSKIIFKKLPSDDPKKRKPDIRQANKQLNWKPKIDLEQGLTKTISYFNKLLLNT